MNEQQLQRIAFLAERGYINTANATDSDLDTLDEFKKGIVEIIKNSKLITFIKNEYMSYDKLVDLLPKEGFKSLDEHSVGVTRTQREYEIIHKTQLLRTILMELNKQ